MWHDDCYHKFIQDHTFCIMYHPRSRPKFTLKCTVYNTYPSYNDHQPLHPSTINKNKHKYIYMFQGIVLKCETCQQLHFFYFDTVWNDVLQESVIMIIFYFILIKGFPLFIYASEKYNKSKPPDQKSFTLIFTMLTTLWYQS